MHARDLFALVSERLVAVLNIALDNEGKARTNKAHQVVTV